MLLEFHIAIFTIWTYDKIWT